MKKNYVFTFLLNIMLLTSIQGQELSEPSKLGVGFASSFPGFGLSGKYNFTETHTGQIILGTASFGFGTNSFSVSGRYLYNFKEKGDTFIYRPYAYGQLSYNTVKFNFLGTSQSFNTISYGAGGGIEFTFDNFVDGLAFNLELGYVGGSFDNNIGSFAGFAWGVGIHYYFGI